MSDVMLLFAGLFLPLFPLSMVFNEVFDRIRDAKLRIALLVVWPQIGIVIAFSFADDIPGWLISWALLTALLYGFRALALRDLGLWISFIATSAWAVLWVVLDNGGEYSQVLFYALGFSAPLAMLVLLSGELEKRFGAAYTGLYGGLVETLPRFSGVLVIVILAVIATPLFPGFTAMLSAIIGATANSFATAVIVSVVWLLWGWAGARLIQGLVVGPPRDEAHVDLNVNTTWTYAAVLSLLVISGIFSIGGLS